MFNLQLRAAVLNEKNLSKSRFTLSWSSSSFVPPIWPGLWKIKFAGISRQTRYAQSLLIIFVKGDMVDTISSAGKGVKWFHAAATQFKLLPWITSCVMCLITRIQCLIYFYHWQWHCKIRVGVLSSIRSTQRPIMFPNTASEVSQIVFSML